MVFFTIECEIKMPDDSYNLPSKFVRPLINMALRFTFPLLNFRRVPRRWDPIGKINSYKVKKNQVIFECQNGFLEIVFINPRIIRIRASPEPLLIHNSWATIEPKSKILLQVSEKGEFYFVKRKKKSSKEPLQVAIRQSDCTITVIRDNEEILHHEVESIAWSRRGSWVRCQKLSPTQEQFVGFGEKTGPLVKNGEQMIFWNSDPTTYGKDDEPLYQSEPIQIAIRKDGTAHGIFYDNPHYSVIKISEGKQGTTDYYSERGPLCYYIFAGPTIKEVIRQITELNGRLPLPPRWVLGYHQCRWSYSPEERVREIAEEFRTRNIPCDSIHLDIDYMDGYRCFTWSPERFPHPQQLLEELKDKGFKTTVIIDPGLKVDHKWPLYRECIEGDHYCKLPNGKPFVAPVWPGKCVFPDFTHPSVRKWWGEKFQELLDVGVEAFWLDMGEPSIFSARRTAPDFVRHNMNGWEGDHRDAHNVYGQGMAIAAREQLNELRKKQRTFIFVRSCYAGIQRYAASWTGDNRSNWIGLQQSIPMIINMGLTGQPFVAADLGGFEDDCTPELLARWYQLGVFYPFCRNHSAAGTANQEPWVFDREIEAIARKYIELRYQLLPYIYYHLWKSSQTGLPIMRPLFMEAPNESNAYDSKWLDTEFFFGKSLLIAPILENIPEGVEVSSREVYLPKGVWFDYWTKEKITGGKTITVEAPLDHLPLFVKAGTVLPMAPVVQHVEKTKKHPLILELFPSKKIRGKVYLDDGYTKDFKDEKYQLLSISGEQKEDSMSLTINSKGKLEDLPTTSNKLLFRIPQEKIPEKVIVNGKSITKRTSKKKNYWQLDQTNKLIEIHCPKPNFPLDITLDFK
ncbi:MAG: DUF4968 domain-containing protein [Candidatus Heimdallarchaeota archaeon]|nr:DUF4968 domain-containing protein [Candidatus Heimdallarchaeota archaeon]